MIAPFRNMGGSKAGLGGKLKLYFAIFDLSKITRWMDHVSWVKKLRLAYDLISAIHLMGADCGLELLKVR